jgi:retinol-binding protein 3
MRVSVGRWKKSDWLLTIRNFEFCIPNLTSLRVTNPRPLVLFVLFSTSLVYCQRAHSQAAQQDLSIVEVAVTIDSVNSIFKRNYIFPEVADKMAQTLNANLKQGQYKSLTNPTEFARRITKDLQSVSNDKHIRVVYDPQVIAAEKKAVTDEDRRRLELDRAAELKAENYGFREIKILEGNIGYLDLGMFADPRYGRETAVAAMNQLCRANALIVDLRNNGGGSPEMVQLISSYFFSSKPVHLNSLYYRPTNQTTEFWTLADVPGQRRPDMPLYVLTSKRTFSAAEEFSYNLKNLKRATLIGERTSGGAHPTGSVIATDKFFVRVPKGRAINPVTKTNWEGTGVVPDIEVSAEKALEIALEKALAR